MRLPEEVTLPIYEGLRTAHGYIKNILDVEELRDSAELRNAIEAVHSVLYMAEYISMKETEK